EKPGEEGDREHTRGGDGEIEPDLMAARREVAGPVGLRQLIRAVVGGLGQESAPADRDLHDAEAEPRGGGDGEGAWCGSTGSLLARWHPDSELSCRRGFDQEGIF